MEKVNQILKQVRYWPKGFQNQVWMNNSNLLHIMTRSVSPRKSGLRMRCSALFSATECRQVNDDKGHLKEWQVHMNT